MILYTGKTFNKTYLKEEGRSDSSSNPKNLRFNKSSLTFNRYKHFNFNKSLFELGNIPLDRLLECINKITTILDKYVNDVSPFNTKLRKLFIHDLAQERDVIAENRLKIGKELVLKFNVDRLCESAIKYKLNGKESDLNKFNISSVPGEPETDKNILNTLDSKRTRSEKGKSTKQKQKSDGKKVRPGKKEDETLDASNLNYYIKYFNYLKLYYQYYLNHFVSVYIFYKSFSNGSRNDAKRSLVHIRDGERTVYILGKLFVYFRKLAILHLKCLVNLLPLSFVYNPDNFINYSGLVDYNDVIYCEMNSLGDLDSGLRLELKRDLFDCIEINRKFDLEEFNNFLSANNLSDVTLEPGKQAPTTVEAGDAGDNAPGVDAFQPNAPFQNGFDPRIYTDSITNFAAAIHSGPLYPINPSLIPGFAKKSLNLSLDDTSNFNASYLEDRKRLFDMLPSLIDLANETNVGPANGLTDIADTKTYNGRPTAFGATAVTDSNDILSHTSRDFGKGNGTSNNNHRYGRRSDNEYNDGRHDSRHDGRYGGKHDPKYPDKHDRYDDRHYTVKNYGRHYEDKHDVKHDRRYSDPSYEDNSRYSGDSSRRNDDSGIYYDDSIRRGDDSRSGSSSSRYSDINTHSDRRRHSYDGRRDSSIRHSSANGGYGGDRRHDSRHDGRYGHDRYRDGRYERRRSFSHSTHSSHSSSSATSSGSRYHRTDKTRRPERHGNPPLNSSSSNSAYSMGRGPPSHLPRQHPRTKRELEPQGDPRSPPQSSARTEGSASVGRGTDARSSKMDSAEKERLGKELKSGKKLKSSTKFSTMNIKEIFNSLASKAKSASAAEESHLGYKSGLRSEGAGLNGGCDTIGSDPGIGSSMVTDVTPSSSGPVNMAVDDDFSISMAVDDAGGGAISGSSMVDGSFGSSMVDGSFGSSMVDGSFGSSMVDGSFGSSMVDAYASAGSNNTTIPDANSTSNTIPDARTSSNNRMVADATTATPSTGIVTASDPDANKGVDDGSVGKRLGAGSGDNPDEATAGKTDDPHLTPMHSGKTAAHSRNPHTALSSRRHWSTGNMETLVKKIASLYQFYQINSLQLS